MGFPASPVPSRVTAQSSQVHSNERVPNSRIRSFDIEMYRLWLSLMWDKNTRRGAGSDIRNGMEVHCSPDKNYSLYGKSVAYFVVRNECRL